MLVVQFDNTITIDRTPLYPGTRYVVSEDLAQTMIAEGAKVGVKLMKHSGFNNFERRLRPEAVRAGDTVALWRHNAWGDNLMVTGLAAYLKLGLGVKVHVVCAPHVMPIWNNMDKTIRPDAVLPTPVSYDACRELYNWHIFYQAMLEENRELDQGCAIDDLWRFAGFDEEVANNYRRPLLRQHPHVEGDGIAISIHSGNCTRTLPFDWNVELIKKLHEAYPKRPIAVFGLDKTLSARLDEQKLPVTNFVGKLNWTETMTVFERRIGVVISPDSALMHLGEGLGIPNIGLWGLFDPNDRAKHYKHHTAISNFDICPHAPCRWHGMNVFPIEKCGKLRVPNHCNALSLISTDKVVEAVGNYE